MKQGAFVVLVVVVTLVIGIGIYTLIFGNVANFKDGEHREVPLNIYGQIFTGGPLVALLIALSLIVITFIIERSLMLNKARGKGQLTTFLRSVQQSLMAGKIDDALEACNNQRGSCANIIRAGLERYQHAAAEKLPPDKVSSETQRAIEEATMLEVPLLEQNLVVLSTVASIATMVGLLGTTIGMIRAFQAMGAAGGAPDAVQLAIGISEALINTAGGLFAAIVGIVAYNFFTVRVDNFTYMIDEASFTVLEILSGRMQR
jgi:biopolymer transport protein ExbB